MNFDLNIQNYNQHELKDLFELQSIYDEHTLNEKEQKLRNNILSDHSIDQTIKMKTLEFIAEAKRALANEVTGNILKKVQDVNIYNTDISLKPSQTTNAGNNFIIDKKTTAFAQSFPDLFYPGTINPLKKRTIIQNLNIDTSFRDNYYSTLSTDFHFDLPIQFSNIMDIQLTSFEMPTTFYTISAKLGNNYFILRTECVDGENTSPFIVMTIPDGNYTNVDMINFLNYYIASQFSGTPFSSIVFSENNTNNSGTNGMIISSSTSTPFVLDFQSNIQGNLDTGIPLQLKFGWLLGYRAGIYNDNFIYFSEGSINLLGLNYLFLVVNDYNNNVNNGFFSAFNNSILNNNILARISIIRENPTKSFDIVNQNNLSVITSPRQYFGPVNIQKLHIQLLDGYGRVIDLNSMDYSFCLTFHSVYDL